MSWSVQTPGTHIPKLFLKSTVRPSRLDSFPVGLYVPVKGAVPLVIGVAADVVQDGIDEVRARAAHAREQGNLRPVGRDQDRGEVRIRRERGGE